MNSGLSTRGHPWTSRWRVWNGKRSGNSSPSWTPGVCAHETCWFLILAQFRRKEGRDTFLGKKNAAYFRARLAFSPFKCSRWVLLARTVFSTWKTRSLTCSSAVFACSHCVRNSHVTSQMIWGFPRNQPYVIRSSLRNLWQVPAATFWSRCAGPNPHISVAENHARRPRSPRGLLLQLQGILHATQRP